MDEFEFKSENEKGFKAWFSKLSKGKKTALVSVTVLGAILLVAACYAMSMYSKLDTSEQFEEGEIIVNETAMDIGVGYTNFVLFGADSRDNDVEQDLNTDSIIIVSLNNETKEIKLLSVYRDTLMDMTDGNIQKCNSAYRRGGAKQAINMLNMNLDLNLQKYITVNWSIVSEVVDMLGGVEVEITEAEMNAMNKFIKGTAKVAGKEAVLISEPGLQTIDGVQATTYARIRKGVGDDYARTGRQRELIELCLKKAMSSDLATINNIIDVVFPEMSTNFTLSDILKYASNVMSFKIVDNSGFPFNYQSSTLPVRGSCKYASDWVGEVSDLHEFLFGTEDYEPSYTVENIADEVAYIVRGSNNSYTNSDNESNNVQESTAAETTTADVEVTTEETTEAPETEAPEETTEASETEVPEETTEASETEATTEAPKTEAPEETTEAPKTEAPEATTEAPKTEAPEETTEAPKTEAPKETTEAPKTEAPEETTKAPETEEPEINEAAVEPEDDVEQQNLEDEDSQE